MIYLISPWRAWGLFGAKMVGVKFNGYLSGPLGFGKGELKFNISIFRYGNKHYFPGGKEG